MPKSEAWKKANQKWMKKAYWRPALNLRKEFEEPIRARASELNMSVTSYFLELAKKDLEDKIL